MSEEDVERWAAVADGLQEYNNYLTKDEARKVVSSMESWNGKNGEQVTTDRLKEYIETQDISKNEKPYYNFWALYTAINMVLSDQGEVLEEEIEEEEKRQQIAVKLAISHLKDKDKPRWIRWYFNL
jgi:hypothetical protein